MQTDPAYAALPMGASRVDALYEEAKRLAGSDEGALQLLGQVSIREGSQLRDVFTTGLTGEGLLAPADKTSHFFAHAMWRYYDHERLVPLAASMSFLWEILGEMKSWVSRGDGFDWRDVWANRLGWEFGDRLHAVRTWKQYQLLPSDIIRQADAYRPPRHPPEAASAVLAAAQGPVSQPADNEPASAGHSAPPPVPE